MLEAVAAVGLAGNVVQLIQFSYDLINKVVEIRRGGNSPPLLELKHIVTLSIQQIKAIKIQFTCCAGRKQSLDDKAVLDLVRDCETAGNELQNYVDALLKMPKHPSWRQSTRQAIKIQLNQQKLDKFVEQIKSLSQTLSLQVCMALQKTVDKNNLTTNVKLDSLQGDVQSIVLQLQDHPAFDYQRLSHVVRRYLQ
ncbi:hypothetical protein HYFRA_00001088 [Hymenoscyphus fraxineus]|uniref:NACHT-NTPase and P-loop NTPases N-terminal domain-containing protein n=1 Tax=Hymenoscyphus fraxineus TaxID=746836 RepID=A0A9N9PSA7_9HELO|nr:hypothetical protein HYFRA_00001088 [Hymenoscyphus fraxineus]